MTHLKLLSVLFTAKRITDKFRTGQPIDVDMLERLAKVVEECKIADEVEEND